MLGLGQIGPCKVRAIDKDDNIKEIKAPSGMN